MADDPPSEVTITLPREKALALFEWAQRFMESHETTLTHPADAVALDALAYELEWALPEVLTAVYPGLLARSSDRVVADYRGVMSDSDTKWLNALKYQDYEGGIDT